MSVAVKARRLELRDGDVVCVPADTDQATFAAFAKELISSRPGIRLTVVLGDVHSLDEASMNAAGWHRK